MLKKNSLRALFLLALTQSHILTHPHMYFAHPYQFGTRFERKGLLSFDCWAASGSTTNGRNNINTVTDVLNIYGQHKMHQVGKNVSDANITATSVDALNNLWRATKTDDDYAVLEFAGKCEYVGGSASFEWNLTNEFFVGAELPFYKLEIKNPTYTDKTPTDASNAAWTNFLKNFDNILSDLSMDRAATKATGIGDVSTFIGWTRSVDELDNLDFLDATIRVGATLGTADAKDESKAFSIAPGYDKHKGFFVSFATSFGTHDYLSFGFHTKQLFLFKNTKTMRMQSAAGQNGFIKLGQGQATRNMGNIYEAGGFIRLERSYLSAYTGYTYAHKGKDEVIADNTTLFPSAVVNADSMLQGWSTHTVHVGIELDLTDESQKLHPKMSFFYNHIVRAKQAFLNHTAGGTLGFSITFDL